MNSLPAVLANKVGVAAVSKYVGIKSLHRKCLVKCVDVPKFVISSLEIPNVRFYYPADPSGVQLYAGAALGNDFLSQFITSLDYTHNQLILEPYSANAP
jgi:hypothetical protein